MRRYDIISGILLILSIIDFALAAPVLVQERRQAGADAVHITKDVIPVLWKRGGEELEKLAEESFKTWEKPVGSSDAHASSSPAPPGPDHGPTNVVQYPTPNPASSTANPDPLTDPSSPGPSSTAPKQPASENVFPKKGNDDEFKDDDDEYLWPLYSGSPTSIESGSDDDLTRSQLTEAHGPPQQPNPKKRPLTATDPDPDFDWNYDWATLDDPQPQRLAFPKEFGQAHEYKVEHAQQPNPNKKPSTGPGPDPNFDWNYWMSLDDPPLPKPKELGQAHEQQVKQVQQPKPGPSTESNFDGISLDDLLSDRPGSQKEFGQVHESQPEHMQQLKPGPLADPNFDWNYWMNLDEPPPMIPASSRPLNLNAGPSNAGPSNAGPPRPGPSNAGPSDPRLPRPGPSNAGPSDPRLPTEPELHPDDQSLSAEAQPEDPEAAIAYALKGKAKESRSYLRHRQ